LLSMWPMPFDSLSKDISPMLTGVIIQHALTIGLHIFGMGQDFSRVKLAWDRAQIAFRARLWALTISTCQRYVCSDRNLRSINYISPQTECHGRHLTSFSPRQLRP
jgi:hypothetical protein